MILAFHDTRRRPYVRLDLDMTDDALTLRTAHAPLKEDRDEDGTPESGPEQRFTLDDLRRRPWWKDGNVVGLTTAGAALPIRAECREPRQYELSHVAVAHPDVAVLLYVPDTEALFSDMAVMPLLGPGTELACNLPVDDTLTPEERARAKVDRVMPRLRLSGPATAPPDSRLVCAVEALQNGRPYPWLLDIHLESVNGLLPKTRLRVGDKTVAFPVLTTGLEPGDTIKLKAGFRFMTALAERVIRIVPADEGASA